MERRNVSGSCGGSGSNARTAMLLCLALSLHLVACTHAAHEPGEPAPAAAPAPDGPKQQTSPAASLGSRKRVRKAQLRLLVEHPAAMRPQLEELLVRHGGFVETVSVSGHGTLAHVAIEARVPDPKLEAFLREARGLGRIEHEWQESKDVTRELVDVDARLRNLQRTEERLLSLLTDKTGALADVLAVEAELSRVRGEVESMTAQLRALEGDVALAAVRIDVASDASDAVEQPDDAFRPVRVVYRDAWAILASSGAALVWFAAALVRASLAVLPWIPVLGLAWLGVRRLRRLRRARVGAPDDK